MDDIQVLGIIAQGESSTVEFKREIDLASAKGKAEFVKDVIALANSASDSAYLLVGIDDNRFIRGITELQEEQLQQIARTYITPAVTLYCHSVHLSQPPVAIGVIQITPTIKPHKIARATENLQQYRVFVRHGTVVSEATPEEIFSLFSEGLDSPKARRYVRAAQAHTEVGNFESAAKAFTEAIEISPTAELFLARARVYRALYDKEPPSKKQDDWGELSFRDYSSALKLTSSPERQRQIRMERWRVYYGEGFSTYDEEFEWVKANASGRELGEALYIHVKGTANNHGLTPNIEPAAAQLLTQILELGYRTEDVYALRAEAYFHTSNFGLALQDINTALDQWTGEFETRDQYLYWKSSILAHMRSDDSLDSAKYYRQAFEAMSQARAISPRGDMGYIGYHIENDIVYRCALHHFGGTEREITTIRRALLQQLCVWYGNRGLRVTKVFPLIGFLIRQLVGEEFWQANKHGL